MSSAGFSAGISVHPSQMRAVAAAHDSSAAQFEDYRARCQDWLAGVEADIIRCQGVVAAPVAGALSEFFTSVSDQVAATSAHHDAMSQKLVAAAAGYERVDEAGADGISGSGAV